MLSNRRLSGITAVFLIFTALTSLTSFAFPNTHLTPGLKAGIISMVVLAVAPLARYGFHLAGVWRRAYVVTAMIALYLNVFVLIVQLFEKVPALKALAPHQTEAPFAVTQLAVLLLFVVLPRLLQSSSGPGLYPLHDAGYLWLWWPPCCEYFPRP